MKPANNALCPQCSVPLTAEHVWEHIRDHKELNLTYDQLDLLPARTRYLDEDARDQVADTIDCRQPLLFMPTAFQEHLWAKAGQPLITFTGIAPCGSKVIVGITDIPVYVDVLDASLPAALKEADLQGVKCRKGPMPQFLIHGFQTERTAFTRLHIDSIWNRKKLIYAINKHNEGVVPPAAKIVTASDDIGGDGHFLRLVARNYKFMTCGWNRLTGYTALTTKGCNAEYRLTVSLKGFKKLKKVERAAIVRQEPAMAATLDKDPTMSASWDIETNTKSPHKAIPRRGDPHYTVFMINSTYSWFHSDSPLVAISCVDVPCQAINGVVVIECPTEKEVLLAHFAVAKKMHHELQIAFNGSLFDWPLVIDKATRWGILVTIRDAMFPMESTAYDKSHNTGQGMLKYHMGNEKMKIDAENNHNMDLVVRFPNMVDVDVRPIFMKLYPKAEGNNSSSLNYYLSKNQLESKEDMPYKVMFKIHDRAHLLKSAARHCHCSPCLSPASVASCLNIVPPGVVVEAAEDPQAACPCCVDKQKHIDCVKIGPTDDAIDYSDDWLPELLKADGTPLCCFCGKRPKNYADMGLVSYYCAIDCLRPQQLMVKRTIIIERRGLACSSYVPLYDALYRADGQKVKNLIGGLCHQMGIAFSNASSGKSKADKEHFAGGYVFPPQRGLDNVWPITGLDFASLYPSLMMTYNHSPDMVVTCPEQAARLIAAGYTLHPIGPIHYEVGAERGASTNVKKVGHAFSVRHNGIHSAKDTHIITRHERTVTVECTVDGTTRKQSYVTGPAFDAPASPDPIDWVADMKKHNVSTKGFDHTTTGRAQMTPVRDGRRALPGERMGIFPIIVKKLFDKRVPIKRLWVSLEQQLKEMAISGAKTGFRDIDGVRTEMTLAQIKLMFVMVEVKQKAIKVLSNTFYGVSGDYLNALYSLFVAAAITESGQANIKRVRDFVVGKGFVVKYGDTDSLYLNAPYAVYKEAHERYLADLARLDGLDDGDVAALIAAAAADSARSTALTVPDDRLLEAAKPPKPKEGALKPVATGAPRTRADVCLRLKENYWVEIILITMKVIANLTGQVSEFLARDNGTCFLNMAYEEVGFPTMLCGKKKYFLVPHLKPECIDVNSKDLMIRGIESVKQGQTPMAKRASNLFMNTVTSPAFTEDPLVLAQRIIKADYTAPINYKDFVLSARYKPDKQNVPVLTFVEHMRKKAEAYRAADNHHAAEFYAPPDPGDKFEYVVVERTQQFDLRGRMIPILKGDKMEYVRAFLASQEGPSPMRIDRNYYIESAYLRIFARFIAYDRRFDHPTVVPTDDEKYKVVDEYSNDAAEKFLLNYVKSLSEYDSASVKARGRAHQQLFRCVDKSIKTSLMGSPRGLAMKAIPHKFGDALPAVAQMVEAALGKIQGTPFDLQWPTRMMATYAESNCNLLAAAQRHAPASFTVKLRLASLQRRQDGVMKVFQEAAIVAHGVLARREDRTREVLSALRELEATSGASRSTEAAPDPPKYPEAATGAMAAAQPAPVLTEAQVAYIGELNETEAAAVALYGHCIATLRAIEQIRHDMTELHGLFVKHKRSLVSHQILRVGNARQMAEQDAAGYTGTAEVPSVRPGMLQGELSHK